MLVYRSFRLDPKRSVGVEQRLSGRQVGTHRYQENKRTMWGWAYQTYQMMVILGMIYFWVYHIDELDSTLHFEFWWVWDIVQAFHFIPFVNSPIWMFNYNPWIGLRENLQETIDFPIKYGA